MKDDRCFVHVVREGQNTICLHSNCKPLRATFSASGQVGAFRCKHVDSIDMLGNSNCSETYYLTQENIASYAGGKSVKEMLVKLLEFIPEGHPSVVRVTDSSLVVFGQPTATNTIGYCHVQVESEKRRLFKCTSKSCRTFVSNTKQEKVRSTCQHLHVLFCVLYGNVTAKEGTSSSIENPPAAADNKHATPLSRQTTMDVAMSRSLPYKIPEAVIRTISNMDAASLLGVGTAWPDSFEPSLEYCSLCQSSLSSARLHPGQSSGDTAYLISELNPFKKVKIFVKICSNPSCKAMHQSTPFDIGLYNLSDKIMVSLDIFLEIREFFKHGYSLSNVITCKLESLKLKALKENLPTQNQLDYIAKVLYNGFYSFEAITVRGVNTTICGICGVCPEVLLGDGNEKNCCTNNQIIYNEKDDDSSPHTMASPSDFLKKLKRRWLEKTVLTRSLEQFKVHVSEIPPNMAPSVIGSKLHNTELEKKSTYLSNNSEPEGDPAMLHQLISSGGLDKNIIATMSQDSLMDICKSCSLSSRGKSKAMMIADIQSLYSSMLVGLCPCHGYNRSAGCTGGFCHLVCRHGCTFGSKLLALTESVRDATDLYLSLKYTPTTFICDSACGMARHLELRNKELAHNLWGDNCGCFEKPTLDKKPSSNISVPDILPSEVRVQNEKTSSPEELSLGEHPVTGSRRHFILGDRFHSSTNPHKSPLCAFHNIDLCEQGYSISTSMQESENNRKNLKRLRSTCQQSFEVHYMYNYLMDFYQNEAIVLKQKQRLEGNLQPNEEISRNIYGRFVIKNK